MFSLAVLDSPLQGGSYKRLDISDTTVRDPRFKGLFPLRLYTRSPGDVLKKIELRVKGCEPENIIVVIGPGFFAEYGKDEVKVLCDQLQGLTVPAGRIVTIESDTEESENAIMRILWAASISPA